MLNGPSIVIAEAGFEQARQDIGGKAGVLASEIPFVALLAVLRADSTKLFGPWVDFLCLSKSAVSQFSNTPGFG